MDVVWGFGRAGKICIKDKELQKEKKYGERWGDGDKLRCEVGRIGWVVGPEDGPEPDGTGMNE